MVNQINKGTPISVPLEKLFLDPNNYRFIDNSNYVRINNVEILSERIQKRTRNFIQGKGIDGIRDLVKSFKKNGYLHVDQVQVEKINDESYRVLEGNRRIATLKYLKEQYIDSQDIGNLKQELFDNVPVIVYDSGDTVSHSIIMGLKHINGNKKWPPLNQAQLLKDLRENENLSEDDIVDSLGIGKLKLRKSLRALKLIDLYKNSDYGDQFSTPMYAIFEETVNKPNIREWLEWDTINDSPISNYRLDRFFTWISAVQEDYNYDDDDDDNSNDYEIVDPIISKSSEIRDLADFIQDDKAVKAMEEYRSVSQGLILSDVVSKNKLDGSIDVIDQQLSITSRFIQYSEESHVESLTVIKDKIDSILLNKKGASISINSPYERHKYYSHRNNQYSLIEIFKYKKLQNIKLEHLNRVNIFAGKNNSGKSSVLEAIYLLTRQNDIYSLLDLYKRRGKLNSLSATWFEKQLTEEISLSGIFESNNTSVEIFTEDEDENDEIDKSNYLKTLLIESKFNDQELTTKYLLQDQGKSKSFFKKIQIICDSYLSSPFSQQNKENLSLLYSKSVEDKSINKIIDFIKINIDNNINDINYVDDLDIPRFLVDHKNFEESVDLSTFGEGVQRIFYIALNFAAAKNGILLIDELDNAIHYSLLIKFTEFIQNLSEEFNVQVFISSHSGECINAFIENEYKNESLSFYSINTEDVMNQKINYFPGKDYEKFHSVLGADLRNI
ncbi:ATP-binding protein [Aureibaculum sp. A20]|uniref:ATP-binding protein n=1 Tax=Aureibaculum flavum TaxID=2795986 RepID=A0ABS0WRA4_9FLAO|nr:ATP-binding protein [Aureibaculum flavum]MBJ2174393.1 ATP-binding protein [Aureibaculum flavum]